MFAEFLTMYDIHRWLRYVTWLGIACLVGFFLFADGGLPPRSWLLLIRACQLFPALWVTDRMSALMPLGNAFLWSVLWGALWYILVRGCLALFQHHKQRSLQLSQQMAATWLPSPQLSLAASSPQVTTDTLSMTVPRLRLPQRTPPLPTRRDPDALEEIPTRPTHEPRPTTPLVSASLDNPRVQPLRIGVGWHTGLIRSAAPNEDSVVVFQGTYTFQSQLLPFGLCVVADGMGGHDDGQLASQIAMQTMSHTVLQNIIMGREFSDEFFMDMLVGGVNWANLAIYQRGQADGVDMGTTLTAALVINMRAYIVNVGDSRTYLFRDSAGLIQITRDHSLVASLVAFGEITPDEIYTHPERSKIYRSLGQGEELHVDSFTIDLQAHDRLVLCSDGLWEMVRDPAIERIVRSGDSPHALCERLVQTALRGGGADNISVVVAQLP